MQNPCWAITFDINVNPEQKVIRFPTMKSELDPRGIASGECSSSQQSLSVASLKDSTLKDDKDDDSVGYFEIPNILSHSCGRDCKLAPLIRHSKLECLYWGKEATGKHFKIPKSEDLRIQRALKTGKEKPS